MMRSTDKDGCIAIVTIQARVMDMKIEGKGPWEWMQPYDIRRFGEVIADPAEQERWCRAVLLGGLPYMWRKAAVAKELIYDRLGLRAGDKVLVIGECVESSGFADDIRKRIGPGGELRIFDITDEARDAYIAKHRGSGGQIATWRWGYSREFADGAFDCVACLQGVQHTDDWRETGSELLRVMQPGRNLVLAEIAYSPETQMKIGLDLHIEYVFEKLLSKVGWTLAEFPYFSPAALTQAFDGLVTEPGTFVWKGVEVFWGGKP
jgi:ubiquinone/menaquinone biosynthesis C-methylase UbiE